MTSNRRHLLLKNRNAYSALDQMSEGKPDSRNKQSRQVNDTEE
jgi:hypothetical protein